MPKASAPIANRKMRVKRSTKLLNSYSTKGLQILKLLGAGNKPTDVAKAIPCAKSNISYWIKRFKRIEAIRLQCHDIYDTYSLTPYGSTIVTRSEKLASAEVVVLEDHAVKCEVVEHEKVRIDWIKLGAPRNWVKLGVKIGAVRVEKTSRNVIIHSGRLKGFDVDELLVQTGSIVQRVKDVLENRFCMVLGEPIPLHKPVLRFYSEEAKELLRLYGTTNVEGVGSLDDSPPHGKPHEEYKREVAKERVLLPLRIVKLDSDVQNLQSEVHSVHSEIGELKSGLSTLVTQQSEFFKEEREFAKQEREQRREQQNEFLTVLKEIIVSQAQADNKSQDLKKPSRDPSWMVV